MAKKFYVKLISPSHGQAMSEKGTDQIFWKYLSTMPEGEGARVFLDVSQFPGGFGNENSSTGGKNVNRIKIEALVPPQKMEDGYLAKELVKDLKSRYTEVYDKPFYVRVVVELYKNNPNEPSTYGTITQRALSAIVAFSLVNPSNTDSKARVCQPHDLFVGQVPKEGQSNDSFKQIGCSVVPQYFPPDRPLLNKYGVWWADTRKSVCVAKYRVFIPYDGKYVIESKFDDFGRVVMFAEGDSRTERGQGVLSYNNVIWNSPTRSDVRYFNRGYYTVILMAGNARKFKAGTMPPVELVDNNGQLNIATDLAAQVYGVAGLYDGDRVKTEMSDSEINNLFVNLPIWDALQNSADPNANELYKYTIPHEEGGREAFAFAIKTLDGKEFQGGNPSEFCYQTGLNVFNTRTREIQTVHPGEGPNNNIIYFSKNSNNEVKLSWKLPDDIEITDEHSIYIAMNSGSMENTIGQYETKHQRIDPITSSFSYNPNVGNPLVTERPDQYHDFSVDGYEHRTYTWRVLLYNDVTKDLIAASLPKTFETRLSDFGVRDTGPRKQFYDFVKFKYDNTDDILNAENYYFYETVTYPKRVMYIDSSVYETKQVSIEIDTNEMYAIAKKIDTDDSFVRPPVGSFSNLTPFIDSCQLTVYSKDIIDIDDDSVEYDLDASFSYAENGKPFKVNELFEFKSHKTYKLHFKSTVYYYNNDRSFNESVNSNTYSDVFENEYEVTFKNGIGISEFRTPKTVNIIGGNNGSIIPQGTLTTWGITGSSYYSFNNRDGRFIERNGPFELLLLGDLGYEPKSIFINDVDKSYGLIKIGDSGASYLLPKITESLDIDSSFKVLRVSASLSVERYLTPDRSVSGQGGKISPLGNISIDKYSNFSFQVYPDEGYVIKDVLHSKGNTFVPINSYYSNREPVFDSGSGLCVIENYTVDNAKIKAVFLKKPTIILDARGKGQIVPTGSFVVDFGSDIKFSLYPNDGNKIKNVYYYYQNEKGEQVYETKGAITSGEFLNIQKSYAVVAEFSTSPLDGEEPTEPLLPPNYRLSDKKCQVCKSCAFADGDFCTKFKFIFNEKFVCDAWSQKGVTKTGLYTDGSEYLLDSVPYTGKYFLWATDSNSVMYPYAGDCLGDGDLQRLEPNEGKFCVLKPDFSKAFAKTSVDSIGKYYTLGTISTSSVVDELYSRSNVNSRIPLNVDYTDFSNFVIFSSAYDRILNFREKIDKLESLDFKISNIESLGSITDFQVSQSIVNLKNNRSDVLRSLDDFEKYLYFESGSVGWKDNITELSGSNYVKPWPKRSSSKPYVLYSTTSSIAVTYTTELFQSASEYDENNFNSLVNRAPEFFRDEGRTEFGGYNRMLSMFGQYFDFVYIYAKEIANRRFTNLSERTNVPDQIVPYLLDYFNIFSKSKKVESNINEFLLNLNTNYSGSTTYFSGSSQDYVSELYMRLLNTAPYIIKTRGTKKAVRSILNSFGISEEYMQVREHGRTKEDFENDSYGTNIHKENVKRYYLDFNGSQNVKMSWASSIVPETIQFKFKTSNNSGLYANQVLVEGYSAVSGSWSLKLVSTGSTYGDKTARLVFVLTGSISCSTSDLPIFNDIPWSVYLGRDTSAAPNHTFNLIVKQFYLDDINFSSTASVVTSINTAKNTYMAAGSLYLGGVSTSLTSPSVHGRPFYGKMTDFRLWKRLLSSTLNDNFVKATSFYGGSSITSSNIDLITWLKLDQDINHNSTSSVNDYNLTGVKNHGTASNFPSPSDGSNYVNYWEEEHRTLTNFDTETYSDEKISIITSSLVADNVLSPTQRKETLSQNLYGKDSNKLSIEISTNQLVNSDLMKSFDFNIHDYIGDARYVYSSSYDNLETARKDYISRYPSGSITPFLIFDQTDGYDYAVIETIKKVIPFKADLQTAFRVEQTALERFKQRTIPSTRGNRNDNPAVIDLGDMLDLSKSGKYDYPMTIDASENISLQNSTKEDYPILIDVLDNVLSFEKSSKDDYEVEFSALDAITLINSSKDDYELLDGIDVYNFDRAVGKTDKYKIVCGSASERNGSGTPLTRVKGFSSYVTASILPKSNFTVYYTKSGSVYSRAFDSATEPTWGTENGVLTTVYSQNHISLNRDYHYRNFFRNGTVQILKCEFDQKKVVEIVKTTSKTAVVFDTKQDDIILRAE